MAKSKKPAPAPSSAPISREQRIAQAIEDRLKILSSDGPPLTTVEGRQTKRQAIIDLALMQRHLPDKSIALGLKLVREILRDAATDREDLDAVQRAPSLTIAEAMAASVQALVVDPNRPNPYAGGIWELRADQLKQKQKSGEDDDEGDA